MPSTHLALYYHIIFATKDRQPSISTPWRAKLHAYLSGTAMKLDAQSLTVGGTQDHIHHFVRLKATHRLTDFVRELKKASSIWVHQNTSSSDFAWQEGYAALTVSASNLSAVRRYIETQEQHHLRRNLREELLILLRRSGIAVNQEYFD